MSWGTWEPLEAHTQRSEATATRVLSMSTGHLEMVISHDSTMPAFLGAGCTAAGSKKMFFALAWKLESISGRWGISLQMQLRSYLGFVP